MREKPSTPVEQETSTDDESSGSLLRQLRGIFGLSKLPLVLSSTPRRNYGRRSRRRISSAIGLFKGIKKTSSFSSTSHTSY
ncbi:hypothetical protein HYS92_01085 [Candidatus Daviesbacteria bacterium]|nr:hypothetical protein [Candidatus Daviesbacteria bacterium]